MTKTSILIADDSFLVCKGLEALCAKNKSYKVVGSISNWSELVIKLDLDPVDILIIDCITVAPSLNHIKQLADTYKKTNILAITNEQPQNIVTKILAAGVKSYLLKDCDGQEIQDAIGKTSKGEGFICSKIVESLVNFNQNKSSLSANNSANCEGINVTERERDIIRLVADGLSNKQIADKLFLSTHTINTHRKNIMNKLGLANTAGLVMYAVKNDLLEHNKYLFETT
ncbi:MAG: response regulator transcription factor [Bacteroidetes bacterium]|nr:response regulator transcription factor [Bacteroidota bacterium]